MATLKTQPNQQSVQEYLRQIEDPHQQKDAKRILQLMEEISGETAKMWGDSMIGFGSYHYRYASGREGDWFLTGFSPRKKQFSLYIMAGFERYEALLQKLGKYKTGKSCLYIKNLSDVDEAILRELIRASVDYMKSQYPGT
jgi:hypothetical protein